MRFLNNISIEPNIAPGIDLLPLIGETAWHLITIDSSIVDVSRAHFSQLVADLQKYGELRSGLKLLDVAAYAHITGYMFSERFDADVTLFDVSSNTLRLGRGLAEAQGISEARVRRVAGDFHELPFDTGEFDVVYISSALHHSWRWRLVLSELIRVTRVGGVLILENEPCRRELCFYRFRTNRPGELSDAEDFLDKKGLLRTVAEPYLGSRPEQLFGMIENQEIRLADLLEEISLSSKLKFLSVSPQICMGTLEKAIDNSLLVPSNSMPEILDGLVRGALEQARTEIHASSSLSPSLLPEEMHVDALVDRLKILLAKSPYGRGELLISATSDLNPVKSDRLDTFLKSFVENDTTLALDLDRATLFGAAIKVIVCKQRQGRESRSNALCYILDDGVNLFFQPEIFQLLAAQNTLFPVMQSAAIEDIVDAFGADWNVAVDHNGVRVATPLVPCPKVLTCSATNYHVIVFARVYGIGGKRPPWTLWLKINGERRASLVFERSESALMVASVSNAVGPILIEFVAVGTDSDEIPNFSLGHLGVLRVKA